jgi:predicted dehydrogenase
MNVRKILLVGLGKASWGFRDGFEDLNTKSFQTHTPSILELESLRIVGGVDIQDHVAQAWGRRFNKPHFTQLPDFDFQVSDIIVISTNIVSLCKSLIEVVYKYPNPIILIEKPVVSSHSDLTLVKSLCDKDIRRILVNFPRIYQPETHLLKVEIEKLVQESGAKNLRISAEYSKGFLNTGAHLVVLLNYLFSREVNMTPIGKVFGDGITEGFDFTLHSEDSFIEGLATYNSNFAESTFSFKVQVGEHTLYYNGGGTEVTIVNSATSTELRFESTRDVYQLEVYRYLANMKDLNSISGVRLNELIPTLGNMLLTLETARASQ